MGSAHRIPRARIVGRIILGHRRWGLGLAVAACALATAVPAEGAPGDLDPTFGVDGIAQVSSGTPARAIAVRGASAVVGGQTATGVVLARLREDGTPDPALSGDGVVAVSLAGSQPFLGSLAIQQDDKVLAAIVQDKRLIVLRRSADGSADTSFAGDGRADIAVPSGSTGFGFAPSISVLSDGRILVAITGDISPVNTRRVLAVRLLANGAPDGAFGSDGIAGGPQPNELDGAAAILPSAGGGVLVVGTRDNRDGLAATPLLVRFTAAGALDPFGSLPAALPPAGSFIAGRYNRVAGAALESDGTIVLGVDRSEPSFSDVGNFGPTVRRGSVIRVTASGVPKTSFSGDGVANVDILRADLTSPPATQYLAMARRIDGRVVLAGSLNGTAFLVRIRTDGTVDPSFGPPNPTTFAVANVARPAALPAITRLATDSSGRLLAIVQQPSADATFRVVRIAQECELFIGCTIVPVVSSGLATIQVGLTANAPVGILVFRVVGSRTLRVGRVPFGPRRRGRRVVRWDLKVNGRRLAPGRYEIVMRAFDPSGKRVIDLSRPARFTIAARR